MINFYIQFWLAKKESKHIRLDQIQNITGWIYLSSGLSIKNLSPSPEDK